LRFVQYLSPLTLLMSDFPRKTEDVVFLDPSAALVIVWQTFTAGTGLKLPLTRHLWISLPK